jgi:biotin synthase-like enzyme
MALSFETGPIRPPNESNSLLIRCTRGCPWNQCKFCNSYRDTVFEIRPLEDIKRDIAVALNLRDRIMEVILKAGQSGGMQKVVGMMLKDPPNNSFRNVALWILGGGENVFLQDANSLVMKTDDLVEVLNTLYSAFPKIKRVTSYARSLSLAKKKSNDLVRLAQAGLSRLHVGLESGYDPILKYMNKGETAAKHIQAGKQVVEAGISLSEYVILGLGGKELSLQHAKHTAQVLNAINPDYIRFRTLTVNRKVPLFVDIAQNNFIRASDEEILREERYLIENLQVNSTLASDHISNLLPELEGQLPRDKQKFLDVIDEFEALSAQDRNNFMIGRRVGMYKTLADMSDTQRYEVVEQIKFKLTQGAKKLNPQIIFTLMEDFI